MAGIYYSTDYGEQTFEATDIDFGVSETAADNGDFDIVVSYYDNGPTTDVSVDSYYRAEDAATVLCIDGRCGTNADGDGDPSDDRTIHSLGSSSTADTDSYSQFFGATVVQGANDKTLNTFSHFYLAPSTCTYDYYIFESMDTNSDGSIDDETWTAVWTSFNVSGKGSGGWRESPHVGMLFPEHKRDSATGALRDMYYAFGIGWVCPAGSTPAQAYKDLVTTAIEDAGIGTSYGEITLSNYTNKYYVGDVEQFEVSVGRSSTANPIYMLRTSVTDLN